MPGLERRLLGRTDITVPSLCLGTMMYGEQMDDEGAFHQMDRCMERGIDFFDTAELYTIPPKPETQGESERTIGRWMAARGNRDKVIVASKIVGRSHMMYFRDGRESRVAAQDIRMAVERSLANLQTDYIDLYQIHWPDRRVVNFGLNLRGHHVLDTSDAEPIAEQLSVFGDLVREGKIRHLGLSNETPWGVMKFLEAAKDGGLPRVVSIQNAYNLVNRYFEYGLAEVATEEQVGLLAYSPIAQGALSGKYLNGSRPKGSRGERYGRLDRYETPSADESIAAYVALANEINVDPSALAMQFVTSRPWVTSNIFGASTDAQLDVIFQSLDLSLTDEVMNKINDIHARCPNPCP